MQVSGELLRDWIRHEVPLERSYLRRYLPFLVRTGVRVGEDDLERASLGEEGMEVRPLAAVDGIQLDLLDLSSHAITGTVKTGSACFIAAWLASRARAFVILSSGNKANSLRTYGVHCGLRVVSVLPHTFGGKLRDLPVSSSPQQDVIVMCDAPTDEAMKWYGRQLAAALGIPCQPQFELYQQVDRLRAMACAEYLLANGGAAYTHFFQPVSSNYGLYGTYRGLWELSELGVISGPLPVPVGVQQDAICPLYDIFEAGLEEKAAMRKAGDAFEGASYYEPTLFTTHPATLEENRVLKVRHGARFTTVSWSELKDQYPTARALLEGAGIDLPADLEQLGEKTGVMALVSILACIRSKLLVKGDRVLLHYTGGRDRMPAFSGRNSTVLEVSSDVPVENLVDRLRSLALDDLGSATMTSPTSS